MVMRSALGNTPVMRAMITDYQALEPDDHLAVAVEHLLSGFQQDFPVAEAGQLVGVLTRNDIAAALGGQGPEMRVGDVMQKNFATADPREMLQTAFGRLQEGQCRTLPVVRDGQLLGLLTTDNLAEVLMVQEALRQAHHPAMFGDSGGPMLASRR